MQGGELRGHPRGHHPKSVPLYARFRREPPRHTAPGSGPEMRDERVVVICATAFTLQENGTLRCPAGSSLWLSELRQENAFTQRAVYAGLLDDCRQCQLREQCLGRGARGNRARRVSAVRRLLPAPSAVVPQTGVLQATRWVDVAGRSLRRTWAARLSSTTRRGDCSGSDPQEPFSSPSPASGHPFSSSLPLARPARAQCLVGTTTTAHHRGWRSRFSG